MRRWICCSFAMIVLGASQPSAAAPPKPAAGMPVTIGMGFDLPRGVMGEAWRINVYLPPGYDKSKSRYRVVYLLDGGADQDFHHISGLASLATVDGSMREFIVVGIETRDRRNELTAPVADAALRKQYPTAGGSARFRDFIARDVKPTIEARYRTEGKGVLMGESLAGLFTLETFLKSPDLFDGYVAADPSLWWDKEALSKEAADLVTRQSPGRRKLYLTLANVDGEMPEMKTGMDRLLAALKSAPAGLELTYEPMPAEQHNTIFHITALHALHKLFPPPTAPN